MGELFSSEVVPTIDITLKPGFLEDTPVSIGVTMRVNDKSGSRFTDGRPFLSMALAVGNTPTARYDGEDDILAVDDLGALKLHYRDAPELSREWVPHRDPTGDIIVRFTAPYRKTDANTPIGPRIDLRLDPGGGLMGQGVGFIPLPSTAQSINTMKGPTEGGDSPDVERWRLTLSWDLSEAPNGTYAVSSLGEAPSVQVEGSLGRLVNHVIFAVGPVQRYPPWNGAVVHVPHGELSMYWFGTPPFDMGALGPMTQSLVQSISGYFSNDDPFSVFLRRVAVGHGGSGATMSFILEYSDDRYQISLYEMGTLLAHEAVHEYALLEPTPSSLADYWWYDEGIADYLSAIGGYLGGSWTKADMVKALNDIASSYYTSPCLNIDLDYAAKHAWENIHLMRVMYKRGAMYFARLNGLIYATSSGLKDVGDIVKELYRRRLSGRRHRIEEFRALVRELIGKATEEMEYESLHRGATIIPPLDGFAQFNLNLVRRDTEKFELGFNLESMTTKKVVGLIEGSRADLAGIREGDRIIGGSMVWEVSSSIDNLMDITIDRGGNEIRIKYWPRSYEKVECYMWFDEEAESLGS